VALEPAASTEARISRIQGTIDEISARAIVAISESRALVLALYAVMTYRG